MKYSKGVMWLDDCRIPFVDENTSRKQTPVSVEVYGWANHKGLIGSFDDSAKQGRFTPNLLVCDDMLNDGVITQYNKTREDKGNYLGGHRKEYVGTTDNDVVKQIKGQFFSDKGSNSRYYDLDLWFDKMIESL